MSRTLQLSYLFSVYKRKEKIIKKKPKRINHEEIKEKGSERERVGESSN